MLLMTDPRLTSVLRRGRNDAITDVSGVAVGHSTIIGGEGVHEVGKGPVRTGVTVVLGRTDDVWTRPLFAGCHRLNGNGDVTGLEWLREAGQLGGPIALTNTYSVGLVRDTLASMGVEHSQMPSGPWSLPVVGETWDGVLNDIEGHHVRAEHVRASVAGATGGAVPQGNVGGGTGMTSYGFKGGIGSASRITPDGRWTVGALVQANHGDREQLLIGGVPIGRLISAADVPEPGIEASSSILMVLATDAPLLPHQCERMAQRAGMGLARTGATANHSSGDFAICFATGNRDLPRAGFGSSADLISSIAYLPEPAMTPLFKAAVEATEAAIINALLAAETMVGRDGVTAHALEPAHVQQVLRGYRHQGHG